MVRGFALVLPILCAACGESPTPMEPERTAETWRNGRDGLCLVREGQALKAGLIVYGPDNMNCSLAGPAARDGDRLQITPRGDAACRVEIRLEGNRAVLGERPPACSYYCGPSANYSRRTLERSANGASVTDFAGGALC